MEKEQTNLLANLYSLRAGLSVISQEWDKATNINRKIAEQTESNIYNLYRTLPQLSDFSLEYNIYYQNNSCGQNIESYESYCINQIRSGELDENRAKYFKEQADRTYNGGLIRNTIFLMLCIAAIATFTVLGIRNFINEKSISMLFFVLAVAISIGTIIWHGLSSSGFNYYKNWVRKMRKSKKQLNNFIVLYQQYISNTEKMKKEGNTQISILKRNSETLFMVLQRQFSYILDMRDWQHLDLVIFYLETGRADSIKEALQLVDREVQTQRIANAIQQATAQICNTLALGFTVLQQTINSGFNMISRQIAASSANVSAQLASLTGAVNMNNALRAKANVSSEQLMKDVQALRNYIVK